jgi:hypothetical protein
MVHGGGLGVATLVGAGVVVPLHDPALQAAHEELGFGAGLGVGEDDELDPAFQGRVPVEGGGVQDEGAASHHGAQGLAAADLLHGHVVPIDGDHVAVAQSLPLH